MNWLPTEVWLWIWYHTMKLFQYRSYWHYLQQFLDIFSECKQVWPYETRAPTRQQILDLYELKQLLFGRTSVAILVKIQCIWGQAWLSRVLLLDLVEIIPASLELDLLWIQHSLYQLQKSTRTALDEEKNNRWPAMLSRQALDPQGPAFQQVIISSEMPERITLYKGENNIGSTVLPRQHSSYCTSTTNNCMHVMVKRWKKKD